MSTEIVRDFVKAEGNPFEVDHHKRYRTDKMQKIFRSDKCFGRAVCKVGSNDTANVASALTRKASHSTVICAVVPCAADLWRVLYCCCWSSCWQ
jgi:hypothetical protein